MSKVMRLKPAKHGKRLDGKYVIATNKIFSNYQTMEESYVTVSKNRFTIMGDRFTIMGEPISYVKKFWTVEEIVESEE